MDISYIINQLGEERDKYFRAVSPPIIQTSNFCFKDVGTMRKNIDNEFEVPFYSRGKNPTVDILRKKIAALQGAEDALITSSGCAAITASVVSNIKKGDHVICVQNPYSWTNTLFNKILKKFGIEVTMVDGTVNRNFDNAIRKNTSLIYLESPNSFTFEMQDLGYIAGIAKKKGIITVIDNSYSTPFNQSPLEYGIDIVIHSASKYINGHSDIVAGVICSNRKMIKKIFETEYMTFGGVISPNDAWLMLRGLRTLKLRLDRVSETTRKVVQFLEKHPRVEKVLYPFSKTNPQYRLAVKQMKNCGGLFSVVLKTSKIEQVDKFCNSLKRFLIACSWGGYESLIFPASVFYKTEKDKNHLPFNLVRMYIGLEEPDVLIEDIGNALGKLKQNG